jgi:HEAT repeat protein
VVDTLIHLIKSEDNILRERSIEALIELHPEQEDILPKLLELISDEEDSVVCAVAEILGQLQSDEALQILLEAAELDRLDDNISVIASDCIQSAINEYENW